MINSSRKLCSIKLVNRKQYAKLVQSVKNWLQAGQLVHNHGRSSDYFFFSLFRTALETPDHLPHKHRRSFPKDNAKTVDHSPPFSAENKNASLIRLCGVVFWHRENATLPLK
jgi:hypothetical protein